MNRAVPAYPGNLLLTITAFGRGRRAVDCCVMKASSNMSNMPASPYGIVSLFFG